MFSSLRVNEYVFDTWALQSAFGELTPSTPESESEYSEAGLRTLLELFADWGPARTTDINAAASDSLDVLTDAEKRDLYHRCCTELASNLEEQYGYDADESDVRQFAETLATDEPSEGLAEFLLNYLWKFSGQLYEFDPKSDATDDAQALLNATRNLPKEYRDEKQRQYDGTEKVKGVRYQLLDAFDDDGEIPIERLERIKREENAKFDKDVFLNWRDYTILGQVYFDYFKPRIDAYLDRLVSFLTAELGVEDFETHTVHFTEPQAYLSDFAWMAIYPEVDAGDQRDSYQLYLGIHWNRITYGLHVGGNLRDDGWKERRDLDRLQDVDRASISTVVEKLRTAKPDFLALNGIGGTDQPPEKPDRADEIERQLDAAKQVVFYGPPGTGKTYVAKRFAEWWVHDQSEAEPLDEQVQTITFHPSFAYEDFIEGLTAKAADGTVAYEIEDGIFKRVAESARTAYRRARQNDSSPPPYVLIVDEINRGNLAQIFGETITQLEADKRLDESNETAVRLAHSDDSFVVPPNLYLIGTMNTADRSIALVDAALRRRFRFLAFQPAFENVLESYSLPADPMREGDDLEMLLALSIQALRELNDRIVRSADLGKGKQIGHARLFDLETVDEVLDVWRYDVLPLLEEYYFGQFDRIRSELFDGDGEELFDWERKQVRDFTERELVSALNRLVGEGVELSYSAPANDASTSAARKQWDRESFMTEIESEFAPDVIDVYEALYEFAVDEGAEVGYGTGARTGAMQFYWDAYNDGDRLVFETRTDGTVQFRFWDRSNHDPSIFENFVANIEPVLDEPVDVDDILSDDFNGLQIPIERLTDEERRAQVESTIVSFVQDCQATAQ